MLRFRLTRRADAFLLFVVAVPRMGHIRGIRLRCANKVAASVKRCELASVTLLAFQVFQRAPIPAVVYCLLARAL